MIGQVYCYLRISDPGHHRTHSVHIRSGTGEPVHQPLNLISCSVTGLRSYTTSFIPQACLVLRRENCVRLTVITFLRDRKVRSVYSTADKRMQRQPTIFGHITSSSLPSNFTRSQYENYDWGQRRVFNDILLTCKHCICVKMFYFNVYDLGKSNSNIRKDYGEGKCLYLPSIDDQGFVKNNRKNSQQPTTVYYQSLWYNQSEQCERRTHLRQGLSHPVWI